MRFVSLVNSVIAKARRGVTQTASVSADDLRDPGKQAEVIRQLMARINKLEAAAAREATEFEVLVGDSGALVELPHGFKSTAVRWSVVGWFCAPAGVSPVDAPKLTYDPSSTLTSLFLRSYVKGRAIIRVEPAQSFLDPGPTMDVAQGIPLGRQYSGKMSFNDIALHTLITIPIPDNSVCTFRITVIGQDTSVLANRAILSFYLHCRRQLGAGPIDIVTVGTLVTATANYAVTAVASGNNIIVTGQKLVAVTPVTWTATVEPILIYLRDEPA